MENRVGLSSSYFATQGKSIYDSVAAAKELGFHVVELGAAHRLEQGIWGTVKRVSSDFPEIDFTVHGLFPPLEQRFWFNLSLGLTSQNKKVMEGMFKAAELTEASVVGVHPGFLADVGWGRERHGFAEPTPVKEIEKPKALEKMREVIAFGLEKANEVGCRFAVENIPNAPMRAAVAGAKEFSLLFSEFPDIGFLLDVGHAIFARNLDELLSLNSKVVEMHLHWHEFGSPLHKELEAHIPFTSLSQLSFLEKIPQASSIPLIFEHANNVSKEEILKEKALVEQFLEKTS